MRCSSAINDRMICKMTMEPDEITERDLREYEEYRKAWHRYYGRVKWWRWLWFKLWPRRHR